MDVVAAQHCGVIPPPSRLLPVPRHLWNRPQTMANHQGTYAFPSLLCCQPVHIGDDSTYTKGTSSQAPNPLLKPFITARSPALPLRLLCLTRLGLTAHVVAPHAPWRLFQARAPFPSQDCGSGLTPHSSTLPGWAGNCIWALEETWDFPCGM